MKSKKPLGNNLNRRKFIKNVSATAAAFTIVPRFVMGGNGYVAPSDTLYIAGIGVGGKGESDLTSIAKSQNAKIIHLCDVDDRMAVKSKQNFPEASYYKDYRKMLEKEGCRVSTAKDEHAAVDILKNDGVNIILLDIEMLSIEGIERLQKINRLNLKRLERKDQIH